MRLGSLLIVGFTSLSLLAGCAQQGGGYGQSSGSGVNKQQIGTLAGAAGGALLGSQIGGGRGQLAAVAIGTLLGAGIGSEIGTSLDKADIAYANQTMQRALESSQPGQTLPWSNPQSGVNGSVTPSNYYQTAGGQYCREYTHTINIGGRTEEGVGRACRQPDGSWGLVQ
ncbi:MAG: glycine zipper 2TM domain-containing protein [Rickettsiales bacterium]|nr:glycine zipper 2TM domain-containing protein [Rickettsiales bacterium]